jgi:hypothetical protein
MDWKNACEDLSLSSNKENFLKNNLKTKSYSLGSKEKENIIRLKTAYPDVPKEENPLGLSNYLYHELNKEIKIEADKAKASEKKHYATILTPDKYQQYLFSEALIKKANENKHADSILTPEEIKKKELMKYKKF